MEDRTETVKDWKLPDPPTEIEELRKEVRTLQVYTKTLAQNYSATWRQINFLRKKLLDIGVPLD